MSKPMTLEKKQKEIAKWEREKARPKKSYYILYLIFIISLVYISDEVASQINTLMKAEIISVLFQPKFGDKSVSTMDTIGLLSYVFVILSVFYKPLSDRFGRKVFLVINTFGMSFGMLIIALGNNLVYYILGTAVIFFFTPHDMQVVYIMESAPAKHRAKIYSIVKCIATLGVMLVPLFRKLLMTDASQWSRVYLIPAVIGCAVSFLGLLFARETDVFIDSRLAYLKMTDEELAAAKAEKSNKDSQGGFFTGLKFMFKHKQLKWAFIATAFVNFGAIITMEYSVIMSQGFDKGIKDIANDKVMTMALFLFPVGSAIAQLLLGFFADAIGRKKSAVIMTALTISSLVLMTVGANMGWSPYLVGLFSGVAVGSYWSCTDVAGIIIQESSPTNLRSSTLSGMFIAMGVGYVAYYLIGVPLMAVFGDSSVPVVTLCIALPGMVASLLIYAKKVHDTKGVNLDEVTGTEWD